MGKQSSSQNGAQDQGIAVSGKSGAINTGVQYSTTTQPQQQISGSANTVSYTTNGVAADQLATILGTVTKPSASEVASATPSPLTLPASPTATVAVAGSNQKKYITYAIIAVVLVGAFVLIRKFLK